jgi:hypothetical protein
VHGSKADQGQRFGVGAIVDVEVEIPGLFRTFVRHGNPGMFLEWHGKEAIHRLVRAH